MSNLVNKGAIAVKKVDPIGGNPIRYPAPAPQTQPISIRPLRAPVPPGVQDQSHIYKQPPIQHLERREGDNVTRGIPSQYCVSPPPTQQDMLKFVRKPEAEAARLAAEQSRRVATEMRSLKEANQRLSDDNQELRDLCCFLDDDRQKGRKLAREWQRFGRYTASVMRQEVSAYQNKLRELDSKQQELIKDNLELKELCLYLDEERSGMCRNCGASLRRDDGDGSSSSTNADEPQMPPHHSFRPVSQNSTNNDTPQMLEYIQRLESRIKLLEEENRSLHQKLGTPVPAWDSDVLTPPQSVVQALQVLEVREQLEQNTPDPTSPMDQGEKALLREMCNVVWRKLEEGPTTRR
uniref:Coiled-coil domain-containing protein 85C n=1 Tax=Lygus hesperus TaxID=30085 RepID=A0A0A9W925_LYGHE